VAYRAFPLTLFGNAQDWFRKLPLILLMVYNEIQPSNIAVFWQFFKKKKKRKKKTKLMKIPYIFPFSLMGMLKYIRRSRIQVTVKDCDLTTVEDYHLVTVEDYDVVTVEVYHLVIIEDYYLIVVKFYLYYLILL